jgi:hypothetical protein
MCEMARLFIITGGMVCWYCHYVVEWLSTIYNILALKRSSKEDETKMTNLKYTKFLEADS